MTKALLIFEKQWLHAALLLPLLAGLILLANLEVVRQGSLFGVRSLVWLMLSAAIAIVHQVYVWFCWRTELHAQLLSRALGAVAFTAYASVFSALGVARVAAVLLLAISNRGTIPLPPLLLQVLAVLALLPAIYLFYSVARYFGFARAFGIDHFDPHYRSLPFVRDGIFRFTPNAMYAFGFLLLWGIALWFASVGALVVALFNHLYIWVHYHATERPDIKRIYG